MRLEEKRAGPRFSAWTNTASAKTSTGAAKIATTLTLSRGSSYTVLAGEPFTLSGVITPHIAV